FNDRSMVEFARREYGEMAGYVQLYLFNHARRSGLLDRLRQGTG
ncbi:MAG: DNA lyase, partial [Methanothermobacter sp.]|nr:DNA lyase [Methanothermobacter sp.]